MPTLKTILQYLWCLPQNLLGLLLLLYFGGEKRSYEDITYYYNIGLMGGLSLGNYIFLNNNRVASIKHEYGHSIQNKYLGPLYLLVIGIPALLWTAFCKGNNYYSFYTEKWADKLGGVNR